MDIDTAEVSFHILRYGAQKLAQGDVNALLEMGFSIDEINVLENLTLKELLHLSRLSTHFLCVTVNHECFTAMLQHIRSESYNAALQDELIRMRAPAGMLRELFGMTGLEYANRRKLLKMAGVGVGRPPALSEAEQHTVWQAWQEYAELPLAKRYLHMARATKLPLNAIWALVRFWEKEGLIPGGQPERPAPEGAVVLTFHRQKEPEESEPS